MTNVEVTAIFYGNSTLYQKDLVSYYNWIVTSTYMTTLGLYGTTAYPVGTGKYITSIVYTPSSSSTTVDDDLDIQPMLLTLKEAGTINPNNNSLYMIHFPPGMSVTFQGYTSCAQFCGTHNSIYSTSANGQPLLLSYAIIPDQSGDCNGSCGYGATVLANLQSVSSHEFAESILNPGIGVATDYAPPLGWYNGDVGEIADICDAIQDTISDSSGNTWTVQKLWLNSNEGTANAALTFSFAVLRGYSVFNNNHYDDHYNDDNYQIEDINYNHKVNYQNHHHFENDDKVTMWIFR
ncbi:hypothetical protein HDU82_004773 [Entophlyctis luteolus]|nr:hypothetical protein HDU82_004773 [Entophlyctis luteolus]